MKKLDHFSKDRGENEAYLKAPASVLFSRKSEVKQTL